MVVGTSFCRKPLCAETGVSRSDSGVCDNYMGKMSQEWCFLISKTPWLPYSRFASIPSFNKNTSAPSRAAHRRNPVMLSRLLISSAGTR
jgi:hypothetical protein